MDRSDVRPGRARALTGFVGFGLFWGSWGAVLPAVQAHAGVSDGELGVALLCIGAGALFSMRVAGAAVDRFGSAVLPASMLAFAAVAVLPALATSTVVLMVVLLLVGAASGAVDVAINSEGVRAEAAGPRVLQLAHASFSAAVVAASLLTGVLRAADASAQLVLAVIAVVLVLVAALLSVLVPAPPGAPSARTPARDLLRVPVPLAILGGLAALAYVIENGWQSWSAVFLEGTLDASAGAAALGPAVFAGAALTGRLIGQPLSERVPDRHLLRAGAAVAALGTLVAATASGVPVGLLGIAIAGLGTSVCAPTLISLAGRVARPEQRGGAVSTVTTLAYLGFVLGPAAVGLAADATTLRVALAGVAGLAVVLAVLAARAPAPS